MSIATALHEALAHIWAEMRTAPVEELDPLFSKWWKTICSSTPDYDVLSNLVMNLQRAPLYVVLAAYYYGFANAVDGLQREELVVLDHERLPVWMEAMMLDDLATRYADKH